MKLFERQEIIDTNYSHIAEQIPIPIHSLKKQDSVVCGRCGQGFKDNYKGIIQYCEHYQDIHIAKPSIQIHGGLTVEKVDFLGFQHREYAVWRDSQGKIISEGQPKMYRFYQYDLTKLKELEGLLTRIREVEKSLINLRE